jgi:glycosyltransferase involved in cell wall biosynthesis
MAQPKNSAIAILSPNKDAYSETFIKAHKEGLPYEIKYYHGGNSPGHLEGRGSLTKGRKLAGKYYKLKQVLSRVKFETFREDCVAKSFGDEGVSLVLAEYGMTGAWVTPICRELEIPLLVHFHGYDAHSEKVTSEYRERYLEMFDYAAGIISVSDWMTSRLIELGCKAEKILKNPYGPNDDFFRGEPDYDSNCFLSIGRFVEKKAPYAVLMAFSKVLSQRPNACLEMAGDGALLETTRNLSKILEVDHAVSFLGGLSHREVHDQMKSSFCFVQHSIVSAIGDSEGMPVGILEASAAGLPVVATRHAGIPEAILEEETGLLVDELDVNAMADHMLRLFDDRDLCRSLGMKGRERIRGEFSMDRHLQNIIAAIETSRPA